ncbi:hypothetical protein [Paenarthrobacter sp. PH39-S1]|uniref:DUF6414 family protein n=1 Tax=Paenarthrobacter sp. PH39-S1 TaxID=3046204 RepID=UPI0024BA1117|nr:hypothetical protein [Paenarthrobacter sp. PH39-S1]MDJ0355666.1 hypothetical protein [Paenarthrobacter sp. PH39-S1]
MSAPKWWRRLWNEPIAVEPGRNATDQDKPNLREFVYLDEVSLRSLLSSQKGGITDSTSEEATDVREAGLSGTVGVSSPLIAKAEIESRFQTSNSSTIQTSRKATVQSWFREFHEIKGLRLIEVVKSSTAARDLAALKDVNEPSLIVAAEKLQRGALVEYRVRLSADSVFHLGTMVSEITGMAQDYPEMFSGVNGINSLQEVQPINKILQRLLAGLIPIRATSIDYVVVEVEGNEYVAHKQLIEGLNLATRPLQIVGVTEHLAYWKDIRRVLFSDAEFTMLCRVSRPSLHGSWTPVKLADLFLSVTPDLVEKINSAGTVPFGTVGTGSAENVNQARLGTALRTYCDAVLADIGKQLTDDQTVAVDQLIAELKPGATTVSGQRAAFGVLTDTLEELLGCRPEAARALVLRDGARQSAGLSLFPSVPAAAVTEVPTQTTDDPADGPRLLDVDVVAIYW